MAIKLPAADRATAEHPEGVKVMVDQGEKGPWTVWHTLYRDKELVTENGGIMFFCTKAGEYYFEGVLEDGSKVKTQMIEITAGMVAAAKKPAAGAAPSTSAVSKRS